MGQSIARTDFSRDGQAAYLHPQYRLMQGLANTTSYAEKRGIWDMMLDCAAGERAVKSRGTDYLPMTSGMAGDAINGMAAYQAYITRAVFPEITQELIMAMSGMVFAAPPKFELPGVMADMLAAATSDGMSAETLTRQVIANQLTTGRIGLLLDPQDGQGVIAPKVCVYNDKAIVNWGLTPDNKLEFVVLDESDYQVNPVSGVHEWQQKYRVCALTRLPNAETGEISDNGIYYTYTCSNLGTLNLDVVPDNATMPEIAGRSFDRIPFVFINSTDLSSDCSNPLMEPVAKYALAAYRNSADYELALYMTAQATTIITGADVSESVALGSNRFVSIKNPEARVTFLEINGAGIDKQKQAIDDKIASARRFGVELAENGAESGTALNTRLTIKTSSLMNVVLTCEEGLRRLLRMAAEWCGYIPDDVIVEINKDFRNDQIVAQDIALLSTEISKGNFTKRDFHKLLLDAQYTQTDDFNEWLAEAEAGAAMMPSASGLALLKSVEDESPDQEEMNSYEGVDNGR